MSQIAVSRPRKSAPPRPAAPLRVVAGRTGETSRGGFVVLCLLALVLGSLSILLLNTSRAKGAFELRDLQARSDFLADAEESLQHDITAQAAPGALAQRARSLGMVPNESAAFLRLSDGRILGVAKPAVADPTFSVVTNPATVPARTASVPSSTASTAGTASATSTGPTKTVTTKGSVTTTTVVTRKAGGVIETVRTIVDTASGRTTSSTSVSKPSKPKPSTPAATKPTTTSR